MIIEDLIVSDEIIIGLTSEYRSFILKDYKGFSMEKIKEIPYGNNEGYVYLRKNLLITKQKK